MGINKSALSERDICTKFITPALRNAGWDEMTQVREEYGFTNGRIIVRGKLVYRGQRKRADYVVYIKSNIPLALIEARNNNRSVRAHWNDAIYSSGLSPRSSEPAQNGETARWAI